MPSAKPVVVGVDGYVRNTAAIRYGAHEARRRGRPLLLVHVAPDVVLAGMSPTVLPTMFVEFEAIARNVLRDAARVARRVLPGSAVSTRLLYGPVAPALTEASGEASLLVLGDDRRSTLGRLAVGSVVAAIAARAPVPVASVPEGWLEASPERHVRRVVVGIKDYDDVPLDLLRAAMALAGQGRARIELAHVWDVPPAYLEAISSALDVARWQLMIDRQLRRALSSVEASRGLARADIETSAWFGRPATVLRERSAAADLLILGRRASGDPGGHLGVTGQALLRDSVCPVEVLPITETDREPTAVRSARRVHEPVAG